jgi:transglutaminase-like putative cysteine protease
MSIDPKPTTLTWASDADGNFTAYAWFERLTEQLRIVTQFEVETLRNNTFDFLWLDGADRLGFAYAERDALAPFLDAARPGGLTSQTLQDSTGDTARFLTALNHRIHGLIRVVIRESGVPYAPEETLRRGEGACRDLAWLFVASCREAGLAARFVSGYQAGDPGRQDRYLHAWAEVYLPGGGWRGFDPTLGLAVADQHVVVATAGKPADAAPVSGSFRGSGAIAQMETTLSVTTGL